MVQLSDDCFAFGGRPMPLDEAWARIAEGVAPVAGIESVPLHEADGRVLAADLVAPIPLPAFDNAAVDGYAVAHADLGGGEARLPGEVRLPVVGRLAAGGAPPAAVPGAALRIFTGAPMPACLDTVFMQEDVALEPDGRVRLPAGLARGANRRLAGEDIARGARALPAGRRLRPQDLGLAAALGLDRLSVRRRLRVGVFSTGDEVAAPGGRPAPGRLYDANRPMLLAALARLGCATTDLGILPDDRAVVTRALIEAAAGHDLLVTSGGVSTGEEDHVRAALEAAGSLAFWRLAIKPGRPVAMGAVGAAAFIGLPGNPAAAYVTFARVARPLVARLAGETFVAPPPLPVRAGFAYAKKEGRREYVRVRLGPAPGGPVAERHPREGAGIITSLTETDGLVELGEAVRRVEPGETVGFLPYAVLL